MFFQLNIKQNVTLLKTMWNIFDQGKLDKDVLTYNFE